MKKKGIGRIIFICSIIGASLLVLTAMFAKADLSSLELISGYLKKYLDSFKKDNVVNSSIDQHINDAIKKLEVNDNEIDIKVFPEKNLKKISVKIPRGRPHEWIVWQITQCKKGTTYFIHDSYFDKYKKNYVIHFKNKNPKKMEIILTYSEANRYFSHAGKMAIVIENFNFEANKTTMDFLSFPEPLTVSLIPTLKKSEWTAQIASEYKKEIIIHLALEGKNDKNIQESSIIMVHYPEEHIRKIIQNAIKAIPNFAGFSNYNESIVLGDSRIMSIILNEVNRNKSYFINTYRSNFNVIQELADSLHVPYGEVTHKIVENSETQSIEEQLKHFAVIALEMSTVIVAAKASYSFIQSLKNVHPMLQQNGVQLVYVSDILKEMKQK